MEACWRLLECQTPAKNFCIDNLARFQYQIYAATLACQSSRNLIDALTGSF